MRDVARVTQAAQDIEQGAWFNHTPAIVLNVMRQPGANVIATVDQIKKQLPQLLASLPQAMHVQIVADSTGVIRASVSDAAIELLLAIALVVLVIFVFLRNVPATIIPSISVPVSLIATLAIMYELDYSIDNLSLMALIIATGFVVDDSIVMIENIVRYLEEGKTPLEAALEGAGQIGFTIMSLDDLADRGADSASVHGRRDRPAVQRIRGDSRRHHRDVGRGFPDPRADDVRAHPAPQGRTQPEPLRANQRAAVRQDAGSLSSAACAGCWRHQTSDLGGCDRDGGRDRDPVHRHSQGPVSGAGRRRDPGHQRGRQLGVLQGNGGAPGGARGCDPQGSRRDLAHLVHRHRRHQHDARTTGAF